MSDDRFSTAIHEAAHVVAGLALGIPAESMSIRKAGNSLGRVYYRKHDYTFNMAVAVASGVLAEERHHHEPRGTRHPHHSDLRIMFDCADKSGAKGHREIAAFCRRAMDRAYELLDVPEIWAEVRRFAKVLQQRETVDFPPPEPPKGYSRPVRVATGYQALAARRRRGL